MGVAISKFFLHFVMRWKIVGKFPDVKKCVVIVVPHTSWVDFPIGVFTRAILRKRIHFIGKKVLFKPPWGWIFYALDGSPVDRSKSTNKVDAIINLFNENDVFRLVLSPEGTRKKVERLKTGFYHIAKGANAPIVIIAFDYETKEVQIREEPFYTSDDMEGDLKVIWNHYYGIKGKVPEFSITERK